MPLFASIAAIEYHLPRRVLTNADLAADFPEWTADSIEAKTGIAARHLAGADESACDLAAAAAEKLFATGVIAPAEVDYLLLCTQSPDHLLPATACILQRRLGLPTSAGALDFNLGCSGFVAGLGLAKGLIETGQSRNLLLLTADTYSKFLAPADRATRALFGDAAAATLVRAVDAPAPLIGPFVYGTDGSGAANLILENRSGATLHMNGPEIFTFALRTIPRLFEQILSRAQLRRDEIDLFIFHQANRYMLEHLRKKLAIPAEKFILALRDCGNTVSSSIPIALKDAEREGQLRPGGRILLVGFGVAYSWNATVVRWR